MSDAVRIEHDGDIAFVIIDNPPVHVLTTAVKQALIDALAAMEKDDSVSGVVLTSAGPVFTAGADIKEMDGAPQKPFLVDVVNAIDGSTKPVAAALFGSVLGGGLEIALACRLRVADAKTKLGFPEVTLGLVPGAHGTQRALRLMNFDEAAAFVTSGKPIDAAKALQLNLIDAVAAQDVKTECAALLRQHIRNTTVPSPISSRAVAAQPPQDTDALLKGIVKKSRGQSAPQAAFQLLLDTAKMDWAGGTARERETFLQLRASPEAKALRTLFLAERDAGRPAEFVKITSRSIDKVGIVGGGLMACGIAFAALQAGCHVTLIEQDAYRAAARQRVNILFADALKNGRIDADKKAKLERSLHWAEDYMAFAQSDLIIEAVVEDFDIKADIFAQLDNVVSKNTILASNTSYLDLNRLAASTKHSERVIGLHFFSPAHIMKLVEIVRTEAASPDVLATAFAFSKKLGKIPVMTGVCEGFCGNRILKSYRMAAEALLEDGAGIADIDAAMETFGFAMGPFKAQDMGGLDIAYANRKNNPAVLKNGRRLDLLERFVDAGRLGCKTGKGWYAYDAQGKPASDPLAEHIIKDCAAQKNIARRGFTQDDIAEKLLSAIQNEAKIILDEGIVASRKGIMLVMVHGYGFPRHKADALFADSDI